MVVAAALLSVSCQATTAAPTVAATPSGTDPSDEPTSPIFGQWMQVHTCDQLVAGLAANGLGAVAPAMVGDFFPDASPEELAAKDDICAGATPQRHSHFFDAVGLFGSVDQHGGQVDDGSYSLDGDRLEIGGGEWRVTIEGNELSLEPVITRAQKRQALAHPLGWSTAGWIVAVAYPGSTWRRIPCDGWC
jgi:hypothetical protein